MEQKPHVAILGAGELGAAICGLLQRNGIEPVRWDADPAKVPGQGTLAETVKDADCVLFCIPSWTMRGAIAALQATGMLRENAVMVSFAKGMEDASGKTMTELFEELFPGGARPFAVVGGPMLAEEISAGKGAVAVFASKKQQALDMCRALFVPAVQADGSRSPIRTEFLNDPLSLSVASVLKNIYAISLGVADGLGFSENEKGWIASLAIKEMTKIAPLLGADPEVVLGAGGAGDLIATGYSGYSRNRGIGAEIARTGTCRLQGEGIASLPSLMGRIKGIGERGKEEGSPKSKFPLLEFVYAIGIDCKPARAAFDIFFNNQI